MVVVLWVAVAMSDWCSAACVVMSQAMQWKVMRGFWCWRWWGTRGYLPWLHKGWCFLDRKTANWWPWTVLRRSGLERGLRECVWKARCWTEMAWWVGTIKAARGCAAQLKCWRIIPLQSLCFNNFCPCWVSSFWLPGASWGGKIPQASGTRIIILSSLLCMACWCQKTLWA